mmetsp:Transcript_4178/g.8413  ORF Transcript_4178/g.8413 Transcript_4178/m.8413 type:complete len:601 (-) Transcript_4178:18-1820(-)
MGFNSLFHALKRRKPIVELLRESNSSTSKEGLQRKLGATDLILYGVGSSIGAGIYSLIGLGAEHAGASISLSFLFCGLACIFTSLAYSEFAARVPIAGSAYTFVYASFGEFPAWLIGWNLTLGYGVSAAVIARSWAEYLAKFIETSCSTDVPDWLTALDIGTGVPANPLSVVIILACTAVLCVGVKESTKFNAIMTCLNLTVLGFVMVAGSPEVSSDYLTPFATEGMSGIAKGAGLVFFAYLGFDMVACLSEEVKNPQKNMPIGIIGSLLVSMTIYVTLSIVIVGMAPLNILGKDTPISNAFLANGCCTHEGLSLSDAAESCLSCTSPSNSSVLFYGSKVINFGALFGLTTACFTCLMGQPRIFYRMAKDGLLFQSFSRVSERSQVPVIGTVFTGLFVSLLAFAVDLESLANMISLGTLQVFTFVCAGVIVLRTTRPDVNPIRVPLFIILFSACIFLAGLSITHKWVKGFLFFIPFVLLGGAVGCTAVLMNAPRARPPNTFKCPMVPIVPLMGIACNIYMMSSQEAAAWLYIGYWLSFGVVIYFSYGIWNSALREKNKGLLLSPDLLVGGRGGDNYGGLEPLITEGDEETEQGGRGIFRF